MKEQINPLQCNPEIGVCETSMGETGLADDSLTKTNHKSVKIIYFTDPICSSCWVIEPQLRKLKLEYGKNIEIEYRMGGLLPNWSYNSGTISKPADVAHHWDEVSIYYNMPIDGDIWLEDPLHSSYPPSIAFKAAQIQDKEKALLFLREVREMVFLQKKNITKWEHLELAGKNIGLDIDKFKTDYNRRAKELFEEDLALAREWHVKGFPSMFFIDATGNREIVYGSNSYSTFENVLLKILPNATKTNYDKTWNSLFSIYHSLTVKEFSELTGKTQNECEKYLDNQTTEKLLEKQTFKNGAIWFLKNKTR